MLIPAMIKRGTCFIALLLSLGCSERTRMEAKARMGNREAMREYGLWLYSHGREREVEEALAWITKAAEKGDTKAMYDRAMIASSGGRSSNPVGLYWFRKGAEAGDRFCMIKLANAYEYGYLGLPKDRTEAAKWFEAARRAKKPGEM